MSRKTEEIIEESLSLGFPGGQLLVEQEGRIIKNLSFGRILGTNFQDDWLPKTLGDCVTPAQSRAEGGQYFLRHSPFELAVTAHTLFDIASLTKIFSLTYLFQYYYQEEPGLLERTVAEFFSPAMIPKEKGQITLRELLSHTAGFEPNPLFYDPNYSQVLYCQKRTHFPEKLLQAPLVSNPGIEARYSDVDFMLLTFIAEKIGDAGLEEQLSRLFWQPLGLKRICYNPLQKGFSYSEIAATEQQGNTRDGYFNFPNIRQKTIWGEVQDEKAFHCMGGVSGHAGLFANGETLLKLFRLSYQENRFFNLETLNHFMQGSTVEPTFGLGWRLNGAGMGYMFGDYASPKAFGHTGWTGCLAIHDPEYALTIIYLTNRKQSPVISAKENPHLFKADRLPAGRYPNIIHSIYQELGLI